MPIDKVVIDATPLILLAKGGFENLLPALFTEITIPDAVRQEIRVGGDSVAKNITKLPWLKVATVTITSDVLTWNLGNGESEVLSFALANRDHAAVIDDRAARKCSQSLSIRTFGTGALLIMAKKKGALDSVTGALNKLKAAGLYISDDIFRLLARQAGE